MKTALRSLTVFAVVCGMSLPLAAAPNAGKADGKKKADKAAAVPAAMYKLPETITLTDEQKTKVEALKKEYTPKFQALAKKGNDILTKEQKMARREAMKEAKAADKKPKEVQAAAQEAMQLSDAQKEQMGKVKEETTKLRTEMENKVVALLTPEQKAELPKKGKKGAKNKKKAA
ncbi:MAG: Spy/CpxP family protein refolding chaperone [Planctomycetota bacterium]|nr:Spy/CpxP family protein refolding chaperone [Planctomycetaceae bacterium]MDQ3329088.1 Spy/CpxP family protein refolding chaperone [Planctomycetota bacterium]